MDSLGEGSYGSFSTESTGYEFSFMAREVELMQRASKDVAKGLNWTEGGRFSLERNKMRAIVETATLELEYPQLTLVPMFPSLYRFLRTEELNNALTRGGETMLVGSGTTLYESLAMTVEQPSQGKVEEVFSEFGPKINSLFARRKNISNGEQPVNKAPLLPHRIVAFEPDKRQTSGFERANQFFSTDTIIENKPAKENIGKFSHESFQNIMLNRLDPAVFSSSPKFFADLMQLVEPGGSLVVTIGTGNNPEELTLRKNFLDQIVQDFPNARMRESSKLPRFVGTAKKIYGPEMIAHVIGRKK